MYWIPLIDPSSVHVLPFEFFPFSAPTESFFLRSSEAHSKMSKVCLSRRRCAFFYSPATPLRELVQAIVAIVM